MKRSKSGFVAVFGLSLAVSAFPQIHHETSIDETVMTKDSNRYLNYAPSDTAEVLIANHRGYDAVHNTYLIAYHPREEFAGSGAISSDPLFEMKKLSWNSDAVVVGTPTRRVSSLTASHRFVFSDYEVTVSTLIHDRSRQISSGDQIIITRPGGEVNVGGVDFRAIETEMPLFQLGASYIFFLHFNQDAGTYSVAASDCFLIAGDTVSSGKTHPKFIAHPVKKDDFMQDLKTSIDADNRGPR